MSANCDQKQRCPQELRSQGHLDDSLAPAANREEARPNGTHQYTRCIQSAASLSESRPGNTRHLGFPEELEKFCTLDKISLLDKHLRVLLKAAGYLRTQASASHDTSTQVKASPIAVSKNHVLSNC
jgi:hypothetical protein